MFDHKFNKEKNEIKNVLSVINYMKHINDNIIKLTILFFEKHNLLNINIKKNNNPLLNIFIKNMLSILFNIKINSTDKIAITVWNTMTNILFFLSLSVFISEKFNNRNKTTEICFVKGNKSKGEEGDRKFFVISKKSIMNKANKLLFKLITICRKILDSLSIKGNSNKINGNIQKTKNFPNKFSNL